MGIPEHDPAFQEALREAQLQQGAYDEHRAAQRQRDIEDQLHMLHRGLFEHFADFEDFRQFYLAIPPELPGRHRDNFVERVMFYLYLVKWGDWHLVPGESRDPVVDYLTDFHKLIGLVASIEKEAGPDFKTYPAWFSGKFKKGAPLPATKVEFDASAEAYLDEHGASRNMIAFFSHMPEERRVRLFARIHDGNGDPIQTVGEFVKLLYHHRSNAVHRVALFDCMLAKGRRPGPDPVRISDLMQVFEETLIAKYRSLAQ